MLAHWIVNTGLLSKVTALQPGFVGEWVSAIPDDQVLVVDDLAARVLIATEI